MSWQLVPAVILRSEAYTRRTRSGSESRALVRYRYRTGAGERESDNLVPGPFGGAGDAGEIVARFPVGSQTTAWHHPRDPARAFLLPVHSFWPYFVFLLASPILALAAGIATGGVEAGSSKEAGTRPPRPSSQGWWRVDPFRPWLKLRDSAFAALGVFGGLGLAAFGHYFAVESAPGLVAVLVLLAWLVLLVRLAWAGIKRTMVARWLDEATLYVRPATPTLDQAFAVRVEQRARRELHVRALEAVLIGELTVVSVTHGRTRSKTRSVFRQAAVLRRDVRAFPHSPLRGEHTFTVPADAVAGEGFLRWRVDVRTRILGADYRTRFPLATPDEEEEV